MFLPSNFSNSIFQKKLPSCVIKANNGVTQVSRFKALVAQSAVSIPRQCETVLNRKLEALLGLFEVAPDAQDLEILFRMILAKLEWDYVINLCLPPISTNSPTMPTLPIVSCKHLEPDGFPCRPIFIGEAWPLLPD